MQTKQLKTYKNNTFNLIDESITRRVIRYVASGQRTLKGYRMNYRLTIRRNSTLSGVSKWKKELAEFICYPLTLKLCRGEED